MSAAKAIKPKSLVFSGLSRKKGSFFEKASEHGVSRPRSLSEPPHGYTLLQLHPAGIRYSGGVGDRRLSIADWRVGVGRRLGFPRGRIRRTNLELRTGQLRTPQWPIGIRQSTAPSPQHDKETATDQAYGSLEKGLFFNLEFRFLDSQGGQIPWQPRPRHRKRLSRAAAS